MVTAPLRLETGGAFGQECGLRVTIEGKSEKVPNSYPPLDIGRRGA